MGFGEEVTNRSYTKRAILRLRLASIEAICAPIDSGA